MKVIRRAFLDDESGLTMIEYAFGGALIISVCVAAITTVGAAVRRLLGLLAAAF